MVSVENTLLPMRWTVEKALPPAFFKRADN